MLILIILAVFSVICLLLFRHDPDKRKANFQQDNIATLAIIQYANNLRHGVQRLQAKHILLENMTFYAPTEGRFDEVAVDNDAHNELFHQQGGAVTYYPVDRKVVEKITSSFGEYQNANWHFVMLHDKNSDNEKMKLFAMLDFVKRDICEKINQRLVGSNDIPLVPTPPEEIIKGDYPLNDTGPNQAPAQCVHAGDRYLYYQILSAQ